MNLVKGIAAQLHNDGFATWRDTGAYADGEIPIIKNDMPPDPDVLVGIFQYPGPESGVLDEYDEPSIQIRVRGTETSDDAENLADAIYRAYGARSSFVLPNGLYVIHMIGTQGAPITMGRDENRRPEWAVNFRVAVSNQ